ncbi:MAG TPA: histidinol-phosphate transaminase [Gemmatimonadaceae bacterium]|jgi:histidinol-phosphate aminotransferase
MTGSDRIAPDQLARADFAVIPRYSGGAAAEVDLGDNTNQWGTPPAAAAALRAGLDVSRYPDMYGDSLKRTIAKAGGFSPECVVTGNGSDDVLDCVIRAFAAPGDTVAHPDPTFVMVPVFARINGITPVPVPLRADYSMDADALLATNARIIYLCSPNNPTATPTAADTIRRVIARARGLVIIDEAYVDFSGLHGFLAEAPGLERVVVCRTLSKAYGLAGLRVGYGVAAPRIVEIIEKSRGPFKLNAMAERAAVEALTTDAAWVTARAREAIESRDRLAGELRAMGFTPLPSATNFLLVPTPKAFALAESLGKQGIAIRPFRGLRNIGDAFRITAAPWPVMERALAALRAAA